MSIPFLIKPFTLDTPDSRQPLRVPPSNTTFLAYIIAYCAHTDEGYFLWICESSHDAQRTFETLLCFFQNHDVALLPNSWEDPSAFLIRQAALNRLTSTTPPKIIVSTETALLERAPSHTRIHSTRMTIRVGDICARETLRERLRAMGFIESDPVEDPGTFCFRGDRLDLFPIESMTPWRIEFFDDEIERIRTFDASTQKTTSSTQPIESVAFGPTKPFSLFGEEGQKLREQLKSYADTHGIPKPKRDPWLDDLKNGHWIDAANHWLPFADPIRDCVLDYLPPKTKTIISAQHKPAPPPEVSELEPENKALPPMSELYCSERYSELLALPKALIFNDPEGSPHLKSEPLSDLHPLVRSSQNTLLEKTFNSWIEGGDCIHILASTEGKQEKMHQFLLKHRITTHQKSLTPREFKEGFRWPNQKLVFLTHSDLFGERTKKKSKAKHWSGLDSTSTLMEGDLVIHRDHGLGRYQGLTRLQRDGTTHEFVVIEYREEAKLLLPVYRVNTIQRHSSANPSILLDRLGGQEFARAKDQVKKSVRKLAFDLVDLYAKRALSQGIKMGEPDEGFLHFVSEFPHIETDDQMDSIETVLQDLNSGKVMDRLVVGDVGFGKTEVAMRAAYLTAAAGYQVAVLVPTTILAMQHHRTFESRFKHTGLTIESISRFTPQKKKKEILSNVREGKLDILIGTHRLLSADLTFKNIGLVIIDEEHRFGVEHKEKLKSMKVNTHFLTLTATPIPRTLNLSLSGVRDISVISTPPKERLPVRTWVREEDDELIQKAIEFERSRGGQIFFLHNRVDELEKYDQKLKKLVPGLTTIIAHGQLTETQLEKRMLSFYNGDAALLLCTTIIESGLDIPNANTLIVNKAENFGLAQLYQIRGRVGRSDRRAYAYLLTGSHKRWTSDAQKRMEVIERFVELGSGFSIASHDLEIRGGGSLLGKEQSGHIAAVGFELYHELLQQAMDALLKPDSHTLDRYEPEIRVLHETYIPESYVSDVRQRLHYYRLLSQSQSFEDIDLIESELTDRFGPLPPETQSLLWIGQLKRILLEARIDMLTQGPENVSLRFRSDTPIALEKLSGQKLTGDGRLILRFTGTSLKELYFLVSDALDQGRTSL